MRYKYFWFCSNLKTNDEVVENICVLFTELEEYGKTKLLHLVLLSVEASNKFLFFDRRHQRRNEIECQYY